MSLEHIADLIGAAAPARAREQLARLQAASAALAEVTTSDEVAAVALDQALAALGASSGVFAVVDDAQLLLHVVADRGYPPGFIESWRQLALSAPVPMAESLRAGRLILIGSLAEAEERYPDLRAARAQMPDVAWATIPLLRGARAIGVISLSFTTPQVFPPDVHQLLVALAQQCAQALERARLHEAERRAREAAEAAVRARDNLIAVLSHDLKNPLTTIIGRAAILQRQASGERPLDPEALRRGLAAISTAANRMTEQLDELLDSTRVQAGKALALRRQMVDLAQIVVQLATNLPLTERHTLALEGVDEPHLSLCDRARVERVVANLLANAVKYSPDGGEIRVALAERSDAQGRWVEVAVADQGIGIPAGELDRIFEPFYRASNGASSAQGTGLGLASARQIAEQHGGSVSVTSREGGGSVFRLRLPAHSGAAPPPDG